MATILDTTRAGRSERLSERLGSPTLLHVERDGIQFRTVGGAWVELSVTICNAGRWPSAPAPLVLDFADLGVHLPWTSITTLNVPSIEPGGRVVVGTTLPLASAPSAGLSARPSAAVAREADGSLRLRAGLPLIQHVARAQVAVPAERRRFLRPDLHQLLEHGRSAWAGNFRVQLGGQSVERHLVPGAPVRTERDNLSLFMVGRATGEFTFETRGAAAEWEHAVRDMRTGQALPLDGRTPVSALGSLYWMLGAVVRPPRSSERATLELVVRHQPSGAEQRVEFELEPDDHAPGCFLA